MVTIRVRLCSRLLPMIFLWGVAHEETFVAVADALRRKSRPFFLLDQERSADTRMHGSLESHMCGCIECCTESVDLDDITAAYIRPFAPEQIPALESEPPGGRLWNHVRNLNRLLWTWADTASARVVNRPTAMESNHSKPWQLELIRRHGFSVPGTLITNDADSARGFARRHGQVIYKSISSQRSIVSRVTDSHRERFDDLVNCPTQFQQWIPGPDVRVHVIGSKWFACEIESSDDDYRYSIGGRRLRRMDLPAECGRKCVDLTQALGLEFSGIDLRLTPAGEWFCFEANPAPGFTFFSGDGDVEIADAVADHLCNAAGS